MEKISVVVSVAQTVAEMVGLSVVEKAAGKGFEWAAEWVDLKAAS